MQCLFLVIAASHCSVCSGRKIAAAKPSWRSNALTTMCAASAGPTPEELLLEAVGSMSAGKMEDARSLVAKARTMCNNNGGPTAEQSSLLQLLDSRLPSPVIEDKPPSLADMFPGTTAAPTGESLVLPGTPSMADLAKKAEEKRRAAAEAARRTGGAEGGPSMCAASRRSRPVVRSSRANPAAMRAAPPECVDKLDRGLLRACALSWLAVAAPLLLDPSAVALDVFALDVSGGYGVQQPAAGFLQLAGTLMPLESALLLVLASSGLVEAPETRARISAAVALGGVGIVGTGFAAFATGLAVEEPAALGLVLSLSAISASTVLRPLLRESGAKELRAFYAADATELLKGDEKAEGAAAGGADQLASFYRFSALASVVVGGAFMLSPVSPLAVYDAELPVTYLARADFGVFIALLLSPVQFSLYRAAKEGRLATRASRLLNLACAAAIGVLDACGNAQVRAQEVLVQGVEGLPDTFRFEANTTAAFYTALVVGLVYLVQGVAAKERGAA